MLTLSSCHRCIIATNADADNMQTCQRNTAARCQCTKVEKSDDGCSVGDVGNVKGYRGNTSKELD